MNADLALLVLRVTIGGVIAMHGLLKLGLVGSRGSISGVGGWFNSLGIRPGIFWTLVTTAAEAGGGLLMVLGLGGPLGPGLVVGDLIVVTIVAHWKLGFWASPKGVGWEFPVPLAAGAFAVALLGFGRWSFDAALALGYPEWLAPAWLVATAIGAALALLSRALFAPRAAKAA